jgi:hypothetical protein
MTAAATAVGEEHNTATARGYHERALQGYSVYRDLDDTLEPLLLKFFFSHISTPTLAPIFFKKLGVLHTNESLASIAQLFFDVFTSTAEICRTTLVLPHFGHFGFLFISRSYCANDQTNSNRFLHF